jgi:imidazole glycerol-phosphate synthase subunit HisH
MTTMDDGRWTIDVERRTMVNGQWSIVVIDYGVGNLRNVYKALEAAGAPARIVTEPRELTGAAGIVLPGVGAFGDAAANLRRAGFERPLLDAIAAGLPLLGICVGMQLLFDESEEMGRHAGLGVIPGRVVRFASDLSPDPLPAKEGEPVSSLLAGEGQGVRFKVPQIGWNQLHHAGSDPLLAGVPDGAYAYFVHSYYCAPDDPVYTVASTDFGIRYASIVRRGSVWGIQCHPEKSQAVGLRILRNFVEIAGGMGRHGDTETRRKRDEVTTWA